MKHRSLGDKLLDVSSWDGRMDPTGFGARSQPHWGFGTAQALWATGFQESGAAGADLENIQLPTIWRILMVYPLVI
jgi:hypothetical protein